MPTRLAMLLLGAVAVVPLAGCATVISGRTADVAVRSEPPQANVTVRDHEGLVVAQTVTPGEVTLKRSRGWFRPARYSATFEKVGYVTAHAPLTATFNPWVLGNLVLGGPFGLGVDLASGSMWRPKSSTVERALARADAPPNAPYQPQPTTAPTPNVQMASAAEPVPPRR